jgi:hypothetical protein
MATFTNIPARITVISADETFVVEFEAASDTTTTMIICDADDGLIVEVERSDAEVLSIINSPETFAAFVDEQCDDEDGLAMEDMTGAMMTGIEDATAALDRRAAEELAEMADVIMDMEPCTTDETTVANDPVVDVISEVMFLRTALQAAVDRIAALEALLTETPQQVRKLRKPSAIPTNLPTLTIPENLPIQEKKARAIGGTKAAVLAAVHAVGPCQVSVVQAVLKANGIDRGDRVLRKHLKFFERAGALEVILDGTTKLYQVTAPLSDEETG